jgi:RNA polymerase sigma factor (sigma-70 family)
VASAELVIGLPIVRIRRDFVTTSRARAKIEQMEDRDPRSDAQLLADTPADADAFGVFYRRHVRWVLAVCARRGRDPELAADVTAEVFATALAASDRFEPGRGSAGGWLFGIALNKLADAQRRGHAERRARQRLGIPSITLTDDDVARIDELASLAGGGDVTQLLAALPVQQRDAIEARIVQERDYEQIAGELELSEAAVRQRVSRGLATLRTRLRADGRTEP